MTEAFERAVRRGDSRLFDDVTVINQEAAEDTDGDPKRDDHGNIVWDDRVETDVEAEIVYRGTPAFQRRADGIGDDIDIVAWLPAGGAFGDGAFGDGVFGKYTTDGSHRDTVRATRIEADGATYVVRDWFVERNGRLRIHGKKEA